MLIFHALDWRIFAAIIFRLSAASTAVMRARHCRLTSAARRNSLIAGGEPPRISPGRCPARRLAERASLISKQPLALVIRGFLVRLTFDGQLLRAFRIRHSQTQACLFHLLPMLRLDSLFGEMAREIIFD